MWLCNDTPQLIQTHTNQHLLKSSKKTPFLAKKLLKSSEAKNPLKQTTTKEYTGKTKISRYVMTLSVLIHHHATQKKYYKIFVENKKNVLGAERKG